MKNSITTQDFWDAFQHTLTYLAFYLPAVLVLALGTALLLNRPLRGMAFFRAATFVPVVSSWVVVALMWKWIFNPRYGLLNYLLARIGITGPAWLFDPDSALYAIIIASVWKDTGFIAVMYLAGLQGISPTYYEAAHIDGAQPWQSFRHITLPLLTPTTFFALIISLINGFQIFEQAWLMPERFAQRGTIGRRGADRQQRVSLQPHGLRGDDVVGAVRRDLCDHAGPASPAKSMGALRTMNRTSAFTTDANAMTMARNKRSRTG